MNKIFINVLGTMRIRQADEEWINATSSKMWEVFAYIAIHPNRTLLRSTLAGTIWQDKTEEKARKYLRQALWQLQNTVLNANTQIFDITSDTISISPAAFVQQDNILFQQANNSVHGISGFDLTEQQAKLLHHAVLLYRGDLLIGLDADWCLRERLRLQDMLLVMLYKLMCFYCRRHQFEEGIACGEHILEYEIAQERTHRMLIALHCLRGNRTRAMQQYKRCVEILDKELHVSPTQDTETVYQQVLDESLSLDTLIGEPTQHSVSGSSPELLSQLVTYIQQIDNMLGDAQKRLRHFQELQ